ncbi:MAG: type IV secretory system conjugative DNA transfer family protein [Clostridia bacterium]|nr:type IV secretory system conjugative DNA transfer family protein [Clostridia bacterium]
MTDRMILGNDTVYSTDSAETGLNNNVIVCGTSGCGKTMSILEPRLLETYESSLIVTVTKRKLVDKYTPVFKERGYEVLDLNFVNPHLSSTAYDPLLFIKNTGDINSFAESIVCGNIGKESNITDPFWYEAAISLLSAEIAYVMATSKGVRPSMADVISIHRTLKIEEGITESIRTPLDDKFNALEGKSDSYSVFALSCWRTFSSLPLKTASCVFSELNTRIDKLFTPQITAMFRNPKKIDFKRISRNKTVLFVTTSPVNTALHQLVNIFYSQAFKELFEYAERRDDKMLPRQVNFLADDFATGGRVKDFAEYISIFREKRIAVTLLIQSESQLESMYGSGNAVTIINNCDTYVYMGGTDISTANSISLRLDIPVSDVLSMPLGQLAIFRRGDKPILTERYSVTQNEEFRRITQEYESRVENRAG